MTAAVKSPSVVFENVSFRFSEHGEWIVQDINNRFAAGEWISIVGITAYALSIVLLLLIQPSEFTVFPFTTGLLWLALGFSIARSKNRIQVVLFSALALWAGIALVLYAFRFPLLGPTVAHSFDVATATYIFLFSLLYSAIWTEISLRLLMRLRKSVHG